MTCHGLSFQHEGCLRTASARFIGGHNPGGSQGCRRKVSASPAKNGLAAPLAPHGASGPAQDET